MHGIEMRSLPLVPEDAFVLTRVDGVADIEQIAHEAGLSTEHVERALAKLASLGAIRFPGATPNPEQPPTPDAPARIERQVPEDRRKRYEALLAEIVDLEPATKKKILDLYYHLNELTYYELLGVDESADGKAIEDAFSVAVNLLHPDRYYGKNLGTYKSRLERVFGHVSEAHALLLDPKRRGQYDQILRDKRAPRHQRSGSDTGPPSASAAATRHEPAADHVPVPPTLHSSPLPKGPPPDGYGVPMTPVPTTFREVRVNEQPLSTPESAMRRLLARKLGHSSAPPSIAPRPSFAGDLQAKRDLVDANLKQLLRGRSPNLESRPASIPASKPADSAKVVVPVIPKATDSYLASTVNLLRIAITREPENPDIKSLLAELEQRIDDEAYVLTEQAEENERAGQVKEAAEGFADAARCKNDAGLYARASECLLKAEIDLRQAGDYAREASKLAPQRTEYRILLARIYLAAGMRQSALSELQRGESLAPNDETIKQWIARLTKDEH